MARCKARGLRAARQDEHRRVRDGLVDRELRVRADPQPVGPDPRARRLRRRLGGGGRRRAGAVGARLGHRRLDQAARRAVRRTSGCGRRTGRSRATASSRSPRRSTRSGRSRRNVRDCALLYSIIPGRDENDSTTVDVPPVELPNAEDLKGLRIGVPTELNEAEGIEPGVARSRAGGDRARASRSARASRNARCRGRSTTGSPATTSSRPRRRRRTSPATTASATACASEGDGLPRRW